MCAVWVTKRIFSKVLKWITISKNYLNHKTQLTYQKSNIYSRSVKRNLKISLIKLFPAYYKLCSLKKPFYSATQARKPNQRLRSIFYETSIFINYNYQRLRQLIFLPPPHTNTLYNLLNGIDIFGLHPLPK